MDFIVSLVGRAAAQTALSLSHNWPYLAAGVLVATGLKVFLDQDRLAAFLRRHRNAGVAAAVGAAVATPLCSCGTTAVVLGMTASALPWAPVVAFMVASPLSSPEELVYSAGLFGWPFALSYFGASILLGLAGGTAAALLEKRGLLAGQLRYGAASGGGGAAEGSCCAARKESPKPRAKDFIRTLYATGRTLLGLFLAFAFLGYFLNGLIPAGAAAALFGPGNALGVPLAATVGLPLYLSSEASLPLVRALQEGGMSQGAVMAFLIAGSGTSMGAIAGALTIARWRIVGLVVAVLWLGAIAAGYAYNLLAALGAV